MLEIKLRSAPQNFLSYYFPKAPNENGFIRDVGPKQREGGEDWTIVEVYRQIGGKYRNTFDRLGHTKILVEALEKTGPEQLFDRPIINYL